MLALKDLATREELDRIQSALVKKSITEDERTYVASLVSKYGTTEHTILKAQEYTLKAIDGLTNNFEESEHRQRIERIAKLMLERRS